MSALPPTWTEGTFNGAAAADGSLIWNNAPYREGAMTGATLIQNGFIPITGLTTQASAVEVGWDVTSYIQNAKTNGKDSVAFVLYQPNASPSHLGKFLSKEYSGGTKVAKLRVMPPRPFTAVTPQAVTMTALTSTTLTVSEPALWRIVSGAVSIPNVPTPVASINFDAPYVGTTSTAVIEAKALGRTLTFTITINKDPAVTDSGQLQMGGNGVEVNLSSGDGMTGTLVGWRKYAHNIYSAGFLIAPCDAAGLCTKAGFTPDNYYYSGQDVTGGTDTSVFVSDTLAAHTAQGSVSAGPTSNQFMAYRFTWTGGNGPDHSLVMVGRFPTPNGGTWGAGNPVCSDAMNKLRAAWAVPISNGTSSITVKSSPTKARTIRLHLYNAQNGGKALKVVATMGTGYSKTYWTTLGATTNLKLDFTIPANPTGENVVFSFPGGSWNGNTHIAAILVTEAP
jgi:hypothetical protein